MWQMQFNIDKCFILRVGRPKHKLVGLNLYTLHNQNLSETDSAKYLGLTITSDLQWNQHINNITNKANSILGLLRINNITNKANSILGLLRRNLRIPSQTINVKDRVCFAPVFITYNKLYMYIASVCCKTSLTSVLYH